MWLIQIQVVACINSSFLFKADKIFIYEGHFGCFQFWATPKLLWTFMDSLLHGHKFSFIQDHGGHCWVAWQLHLHSEWNYQTIFQNGYAVLHSLAMHERSSFSVSSPTVGVVTVRINLEILIGMHWYLTVLLIWVSMMVRGVEFFPCTYLLTVCLL